MPGLPQHILEVSVIGLLLLGVILGATLLWKRTRRVAALTQLVAVTVVFVSWAFSEFLRFAADARVSLPDVLWSESLETVMFGALVIGVAVFAVGYLWYAL